MFRAIAQLDDEAAAGTLPPFLRLPVDLVLFCPGLILQVAVADSRRLASGGSNQLVQVWDVASGELLQTYRGGHTNVVAVMSLIFNPRSESPPLLIGGSWDETVRLWDPTGQEAPADLPGHTGRIALITFNPDGRLMASAGHDQSIRVWDVATGQLTFRCEGHTDIVAAVAFSPDGAMLASSSYDETIKLWDVHTGEHLDSLLIRGPYAGMNINGTTGLTSSQKQALEVLGAVA